MPDRKKPTHTEAVPAKIATDEDPPEAVLARWYKSLSDWYFPELTTEEVKAAWAAYKASIAAGRGGRGDRTPDEVRRYFAIFFTSWDGKDDATAMRWSEGLDTVDREGLADKVQRARTGKPLQTFHEAGLRDGLLNKAPPSP